MTINHPVYCLNLAVLFQDEDQEDDYKSADDQVTSNIEDIAAESVDYSEEAGLPAEEAVRGEPATEEHHFMTINTDTGIIPDSEINQHSVMVAPPSVITQSTMMRYVLWPEITLASCIRLVVGVVYPVQCMFKMLIR